MTSLYYDANNFNSNGMPNLTTRRISTAAAASGGSITTTPLTITEGGTIGGNLVITGLTNSHAIRTGTGIIFGEDQSVQNTAYTDEKDSSLADVIDRTSKITRTTTTHIVDGLTIDTLNVESSLDIPNAALAPRHIDGLVGHISAVNAFMEANDQTDGNIVMTITELQGQREQLRTDVDGHTNLIGELQTLVQTNTDGLAAVQTQADTASLFITNITTTQNDHSTLLENIAAELATDASAIALHTDSITALETLTSSHTDGIATLQGTVDGLTADVASKMLMISVDNKLDIGLVGNGDILANELSSLSGISSNVQSQIDSVVANVSSLTGLQNIDISDINAIEANVSTLQSGFTDLSNNLATVSASIADVVYNSNTSQQLITEISNQMGDITYTANQNNAIVAGLTDTLTAIDASFVQLTSADAAINSTISTLDNLVRENNTSVLANISSLTSTVDASFSAVNSQIDGLTSSKQNLLTTTNRLPINCVNLTGSSLENVDISDSLQASLDSLSNQLDSHATSINTLGTNIATLEDADIIHTNAIADLNTLATGLQNNKQDVISSSNLLDASLVNTVEGLLSAKLAAIDSDIVDLNNQKHPLIDSSHKLSASLVDLSGNALQYCDVNSSLSGIISGINSQISTLTTLQSGDLLTFQSIQDNFDLVETSLAGKQATIDSTHRLDASLVGNGLVNNTVWNYLQNIDADVQTQINNLQTADNAIHSISYTTGLTTIAETTKVATLKFGDDTEQVSAFTSAKDTALGTASNNIADLQTSVQNHQTDISNLQTSLSSKMDIIDSSNKLPIANVDLGTSALSYVDIASSLSSTISGINSAISGLQTYDQSQTSLNTSIAGDIADLQTGKQNTISSSAKVSSDYISYNGATVKSNLDTLFDYTTSNDAAIATITGDIGTINTTLGTQQTINSIYQTAFDNYSTLISSVFTLAEGTEASLGTLYTTVAGKQDTISVSNRVASSLISHDGTTLDSVLSSQETINSGFTNAFDANTTLTTSLSSAITSLQSSDSVQTGLITDIRSDVAALESGKQNVIDSAHKLSSDLVAVSTETLTSSLSTINTSLSSLASSKQDVLDASGNKLPISHVDISTSALRFVDISANLQSQLTSINSAISTIQGLQNGDITSFAAVDVSLNALESGKVNVDGSITMTGDLVFGAGTKIKYDSGTSGHVLTSDASGNLTLQAPASGGGSGGASYDSITYDSGTTTTTITGTTVVDTLKFADASEQSIAFSTAKNSALSAATSAISTIESNITSINSSLSSKMDTIDSSHKLASSNVDYTGTPLVYVDAGLTQDISTSLSTINSSLSSLATSDSSQTSAISSLSSTVSGLQTSKQDTIDSTHRLDAALVGAGDVSNTELSYLDGVSSSIQTQLDGKLSTSGGTLTNDLTFASGKGLVFTGQTANQYMRSDANGRVVLMPPMYPNLSIVIGTIATAQPTVNANNTISTITLPQGAWLIQATACLTFTNNTGVASNPSYSGGVYRVLNTGYSSVVYQQQACGSNAIGSIPIGQSRGSFFPPINTIYFSEGENTLALQAYTYYTNITNNTPRWTDSNNFGTTSFVAIKLY